MPIPIPERAITLQRPWATQILNGEKRCENRTWRFPATVPLPAWIALHDGVGLDKDGFSWLRANGLLDGAEIKQGGHIVAVMQIVACQDVTKDTYSGGGAAIYAHGPYAWHIGDVIALSRPIPARGKQGLWMLDNIQRVSIARQIAEVQS